MNITKKALIVSAMLALSSQVFADTDAHHETRVFKTADAATKTIAYNMAFEKLQTLEADTSTELNHDLGNLSAASRNVTLNDGAYITVAEKMNENGDILYNGLVHVAVDFNGMN